MEEKRTVLSETESIDEQGNKVKTIIVQAPAQEVKKEESKIWKWIKQNLPALLGGILLGAGGTVAGFGLFGHSDVPEIPDLGGASSPDITKF